MTNQQRRFIAEYLVDFNAARAAKAAGYSARSARQVGYVVLRNPAVAAEIKAHCNEAAETLGINRGYVLAGLKENFERSMVAVPVLDNEGKQTGEYQYEGNVANKALELMGKHLAMFADKVEHSGNDGKPIPVSVVHEIVDPAAHPDSA